MTDELKDAVIDAAEDLIEDAGKKIAEDLLGLFTKKVVEEAPHITELAEKEIAKNAEDILDKVTEIIKHPS